MVFLYLAGAFLIYGLLARLCPCNPGQRILRGRDLVDNALFWFTGVIFYGDLTTDFLRFGAGLFASNDPAGATATLLNGFGPMSRLPLLAQAALILVAVDFAQYWLHRLFHGSTFWPFHAIHHSVEDLDWTTTYRIDPLSFCIYVAGVFAFVHLAGFSAAAFAVVTPVNMVMGGLVHANLNWTFGPFRYVVSSPVFHRWHHSKDPAARDRNFAPNFPIWDVMFGTFYMPEGELPKDYGVDGVPHHYVAQILYPYRVLAERAGLIRKPDVGAAAA